MVRWACIWNPGMCSLWLTLSRSIIPTNVQVQSEINENEVSTLQMSDAVKGIVDISYWVENRRGFVCSGNEWFVVLLYGVQLPVTSRRTWVGAGGSCCAAACWRKLSRGAFCRFPWIINLEFRTGQNNFLQHRPKEVKCMLGSWELGVRNLDSTQEEFCTLVGQVHRLTAYNCTMEGDAVNIG
jgi:hypothetical protein